MARIVIEIDDDDLATLTSAAAVAERSVEQFIIEEMLEIADLINVSGNLKHVTLARHRQPEREAFFEAFNKSGRAAAPVREWARRWRDRKTE